jgi:hypothetical protein
MEKLKPRFLRKRINKLNALRRAIGLSTVRDWNQQLCYHQSLPAFLKAIDTFNLTDAFLLEKQNASNDVIQENLDSRVLSDNSLTNLLDVFHAFRVEIDYRTVCQFIAVSEDEFYKLYESYPLIVLKRHLGKSLTPAEIAIREKEIEAMEMRRCQEKLMTKQQRRADKEMGTVSNNVVVSDSSSFGQLFHDLCKEQWISLSASKYNAHYVAQIFAPTHKKRKRLRNQLLSNWTSVEDLRAFIRKEISQNLKQREHQLNMEKESIKRKEEQRIKDQLSLQVEIKSTEPKLKMVQSRNIDRRGFVYIVTSPSFPGWIKIGQTMDLNQRLVGFNTHNPHGDFSFAFYHGFPDRVLAEKVIHKFFAKKRGPNGEWFQMTVEEARSTILELSERIEERLAT